MKHFTLFSLLLFLFNISASAQNKCGHDLLYQDLLESGVIDYSYNSAFSAGLKFWRDSNPGSHTLSSPVPSFTGGSGCDTVNYIIPVLVHIVHKNTTSIGSDENIDSLQIVNQLNMLNSAFINSHGSSINTGIQFALAKKLPDGSPTSGILRHGSDRFTNPIHDIDSAYLIFKEYNIAPLNYLNIYVVEEILDNNGNPTPVAGYATRPDQIGVINQGIVIEYDKFGHYSYGSPVLSGSEGEVLVHEAGHYLGLYHPWWQNCRGSKAPDCSTKGDLCCDVAQSSGEQIVCSMYNSCADSSDNDAIHNYMMYTPESCKDEFTENQLDIMLYSLSTFRSALVLPQNVNKTDAEGCYWTAKFYGTNLVCLGDTAHFEAYDLGSSLTYRWVYRLKTDPDDSTVQVDTYKTSIANLGVGTYNISLDVIDGTDTLRYNYPYDVLVDSCIKLKSTSSNWLFGNEAGIQFFENKVIRDIEPRKNAPNIRSYEGSVSASDQNGNLLFYAGGKSTSLGEDNGVHVFGDNYEIVENYEIDGSSSSSQSMINIPFHSDTTKFYIVSRAYSNDGFNPQNTFNYNVIDVDIIGDDEEHGKIISADNSLTDSLGNKPGPSELVSAIKRCDDSTYWLLTTNRDSNSVEFYIVSDTGIAFSHRQTIFVANLSPSAHVGFIKFSPDGNWVWVLNSLYRFCRQDGSLATVFNDSLSNNNNIYGIAFSPNSTKLYITGGEYDGTGNPAVDTSYTSYLYQYDLTYDNVQKSKVKVVELEEYEDNFGDYYRAMQIGPDNKIYVSAINQVYLAVINKPNKKVLTYNECEFQSIGPILSVGLDGGISILGLPNFIDAKGPSELADGFTVRRLNCFDRNFIPITCCASTYKWYFGDGDSSDLETPDHTYSSEGAYTVTLIIGDDTVKQLINIGFGEPLEIFGRTVLCADTNIIYEYSTNQPLIFDFDWSVTNGAVLNNNYYINVDWSDSGTVNLLVTDSSGCVDSSSLVVRYRDSIDVDFEYINTSCNTVNFSTIIYCDSEFKWYFGDGDSSGNQNPVHIYQDTGTYNVQLITDGDTATKQIQIGAIVGNLIIQGIDENCTDTTEFTYTVNYSPSYTYSWSATGQSSLIDSANTAKIIWSESGEVKVIVTDTVVGCTDSTTLQVNKVRVDSVDFDYDINNCLEVSFTTLDYCGFDKYWDFGDNTTSTEQNPVHEYDTFGNYTVTLIVDGDTMTKNFSILLNFPAIEGDSTICDTSSGNDYTLSNITGGYSYTWSTGQGTILNSTNTTASAKFYDDTYLRVNILSHQGCVDSTQTSIYVYPSLTNSISSNAPYCSADSSSIITGSEPTGGPGQYNYKWFSSIDNTIFTTIAGANGKDHYLLDSFTNNRYFKREVTSGNCISLTNALTIHHVLAKNEIFIVDTPCFAPDSFGVSGSSYAFMNHATPIIRTWYYSNDGTSWTNVDSAVAPDHTHYVNYAGYSSDTSYYLYRRLQSSYWQCDESSNVLKLNPSVYIKTQPVTDYICDPTNDFWTYKIELQNFSGGTVTVTGEYKSQGNPSFIDVGSGDSISAMAGLPPTYTGTDTFRFKIISPCGTFYSDKVLLVIQSTGPSISMQPNSPSEVDLGETASFGVSASGDAALFYLWQLRPNGGSWIDIQNGTSNTLDYTPYDICYDDADIRVQVSNACGSVTSSLASIEIADPSDIWIRDSWDDIGSEPNPDSSHYQIFRSPDIWNRLEDNSTYFHQNPEYKIFSPNYINIKVRNKSTTDSTYPTPLYLYWTFAAINGEIWKKAWFDSTNNRYWNTDSSKYFPLGKQINEDPIMVPRIAPGDSTVIRHAWYPPSPLWYKYRFSGTWFYDDKINVCVLARLEHCEDYPHKMAIDELLNSPVKTNVVNNNNIATRNMWVKDSIPGNDVYTPWTRAGALVDENIRIRLDRMEEVFQTYYNLFIQVDDILSERMDSSGNMGTGTSKVGSNEYAYNSDTAVWFDNIDIDSNYRGHLRLRLVPKVPEHEIPAGNYTVSVSQYNYVDNSYIGECIFRFIKYDSPMPKILKPQDQEEDYKEIQVVADDTIVTVLNKNANYINLYPNPAEDLINIHYTLVTDQSVGMVILDKYGRKVKQVLSNGNKGLNTAQIDLNDLAFGPYVLTITIDEVPTFIKFLHLEHK